MKNISVIGHIVRDKIISPQGKVVRSPGGIANSLAAFGAIADSSIKTLPVCKVGYDLYDEAMTFFKKFPSIDFSLVRKINIKNKIHELRYTDSSYREEYNIGELPLIKPELLENIPRLDIVLLNYIGGNEFPPRYISRLKGKYKPFVYLDYHSLALGRKYVDNNRHICVRHFRYNPHWREYVELADMVQMNHMELKSIFPHMAETNKDVIECAKIIHAQGPQAVIITREDKDLVVVSGKKGKPDINLLAVKPVKKIADPTGCGDAFAAAVIINYMKSKNIIKACEYGLYLASQKIGFSGLDGFLDLRKGK
jgi:hypothetical protein